MPPSLGASCKEIRKITVANVYTIYTFTETHATLMGGTILVADAIKTTTQNMLRARLRRNLCFTWNLGMLINLCVFH